MPYNLAKGMALILCLVHISGCGSGENNNNLQPDTTSPIANLVPISHLENQSTYRNYEDNFVLGVQEVLADIRTYTASITDCDTNQDALELNHPCKLTTFNIREALHPNASNEALDSSLGQRILLIDAGLGQSVIRYPKRILQMYE